MTNVCFTRDGVRKVDQYAVEHYHIPSIVLMENAARGLADVARQMLGEESSRVLIVCGSGNNGGDGYAAARHLHNAGMDVTLIPVGQPRDDSDAAINAAITRVMNLAELDAAQRDSFGSCDLIIDALFGTGLDRAVKGDAAAMIEWINAHDAPVLAADVPSGLDCNTGQPLGVAIRAHRTATFAGSKIGFANPTSCTWTGKVDVIDIGVPIEVLSRFAAVSQQK